MTWDVRQLFCDIDTCSRVHCLTTIRDRLIIRTPVALEENVDLPKNLPLPAVVSNVTKTHKPQQLWAEGCSPEPNIALLAPKWYQGTMELNLQLVAQVERRK